MSKSNSLNQLSDSPTKGKNKDINSFQTDVKKGGALPSMTAQNEKYMQGNKSLQQTLEGNLLDP